MERLTQTHANPLKSEHLNEKVKPILICLEEEEAVIRRYKNDSTSLNVEYGLTIEDNEDSTLTSFNDAAGKTAIFSKISECAKFSGGFYNCIGIVAVGTTKDSGTSISSLSHINSFCFGNDDYHRAEDIQSKIFTQLKNASEPGTIDVVLFGGHTSDKSVKVTQGYIDALLAMGKACVNIFGFEPVVFAPKQPMEGLSTDVFFDTAHRHLYLSQSLSEWDGYKRQFVPSEAQTVVPQPVIAPPKRFNF